MTPTITSNQHLQSQERRIMRRTRFQRRERKDGSGGAKRRKKPLKSCRREVENGGKVGGRVKQRRVESMGSVRADPGYLANSINSKEAEREAQGAEGLRKKCRDTVSPLSRLIRIAPNHD